VVRMDLPPLRRRREDIPLLVEHFVARFNRLQGKAVGGVAPDAMALLMAHDYPGNVRELENLLERAFVLCREGEIQRRHLPAEWGGRAATEPAIGGQTLAAQVRVAESLAIRTALARAGNNRTAAARALGIDRTTLVRKMHELGLPLPEADGRRRSAS